MEISNEMDDKSQSVCLARGILRCLKDFYLPLQHGGDAGTRRAVLFKIASWSATRDVDKVPLAGFGMLLAVVVSPGGCVGDGIEVRLLAIALEARIDAIFFKDAVGHRPRVRSEMGFGDQRNCFMPHAAPGPEPYGG